VKVKTERYIFQGEINEVFARKLDGFHNEFVETMLLCGVDFAGTPLDEIKMTKNPKYDLGYYQKVVGGILKIDPSIFVCAIDDKGELLAEMYFTHLDDGKDINHIFLLQNVYQWENSAHYCSQVWNLNPTNMCNINHYWNETH
jgi:hypothetical protein